MSDYRLLFLLPTAHFARKLSFGVVKVVIEEWEANGWHRQTSDRGGKSFRSGEVSLHLRRRKQRASEFHHACLEAHSRGQPREEGP